MTDKPAYRKDYDLPTAESQGYTIVMDKAKNVDFSKGQIRPRRIGYTHRFRIPFTHYEVWIMRRNYD